MLFHSNECGGETDSRENVIEESPTTTKDHGNEESDEKSFHREGGYVLFDASPSKFLHWWVGWGPGLRSAKAELRRARGTEVCFNRFEIIGGSGGD